MTTIRLRNARPSDSEAIWSVVDAWWGRPVHSDTFSRFFVTHFNETCFVAESDGQMLGFLIGFLSQSHLDEAYIRFVVVRPEDRGQGVGRALYEAFFRAALSHGRSVIRCVTSPKNTGSVAFHQRLGFEIEARGDTTGGLPVYRNYHGRPGTDRVVFKRTLSSSRGNQRKRD